MGPNARKLVAVLLTVMSLAIAAGAAWLFSKGASHSGLCLCTLKVYSIFWFTAAALSVVAGVYVASPVALTASALGFVSFATICVLDPGSAIAMPDVTFIIEIAAPAFFILAWLFIVVSAFRSPLPAVRRWGWIWLTFALALLCSFPAYNYGRFSLYRLRNEHLLTAAANTVLIAEQLDAWRAAYGAYPARLEDAGIDPAIVQLPYRDQKIKYFGSPGMFILTFEDPLHAGSVVYSWDTSKKGWYPADPYDALNVAPHNLFLGALNPR